MKKYLSVERDAENEIVIERSRFITYVSPCKTEDEARAFIEKIRKLNSLATHNCYAFVCEKGAIKRFSDDGEPSGTAGVPILDAIVGGNLVDVCVVVTRYFGGVKLGAGGLTRAYSKSASSGIKTAGVCEWTLCSVFEIIVSYEKFSKINQLFINDNANVLSVDYDEQVKITFAVQQSQVDFINAELMETLSGNVNIHYLRDEYIRRI